MRNGMRVFGGWRVSPPNGGQRAGWALGRLGTGWWRNRFTVGEASRASPTRDEHNGAHSSEYLESACPTGND